MKVEELDLRSFATAPRYLSAKRFAELAELPHPLVERWMNHGLLPTKSFGRHVLIDLEMLQELRDSTS